MAAPLEYRRIRPSRLRRHGRRRAAFWSIFKALVWTILVVAALVVVFLYVFISNVRMPDPH